MTLKKLHEIKIENGDRSLLGPVFISIINKILHEYFGKNNNL